MNLSQPSTIVITAIEIIFYLVMAGFVLYSLLAIYALLRYGRSKILSMSISVLYLIISAGLYAAAMTNLHNLKF